MRAVDTIMVTVVACGLVVASLTDCSVDATISSPTPPASATPQTASTPTAAPAPLKPQAPPPCIHEVCGERLARQRCVSWTGQAYSSCSTWVFDYEHHCTCDRWGTAPAEETKR